MTSSLFGMKILESLNAVEQDGYEDKEIQVERGGFWERLFDPDPTLPLWQKTKTRIIQVPHYKPAMYQIADQFIVHPALMPAILDAIKAKNTTRSDTFSWR